MIGKGESTQGKRGGACRIRGGAPTQQAPARSKPWRPATLSQGWDVRTQASSGRRSLDGNQLRRQRPKHGTPEERRVPRSSLAGQGSSAEDKVRTKLNEVSVSSFTPGQTCSCVCPAHSLRGWHGVSKRRKVSKAQR